MKPLRDTPGCEPVTDWFPSDIKPVRRGWYECEACDGRRHYFDGSVWRQSDETSSYEYQVPFGWRGLARKP